MDRLRTRANVTQELAFAAVLAGSSLLGCAGAGGKDQDRAPGTSQGDSDGGGTEGGGNGTPGTTAGDGDSGGSALDGIELVRDTHGVAQLGRRAERATSIELPSGSRTTLTRTC